jgi:hypothetical protein
MTQRCGDDADSSYRSRLRSAGTAGLEGGQELM